jgi:hypothetical protein
VHGLADDVLTADAEDGLPVPVDNLVAPVDILEVDRCRGIVEDVLQAFLALAQLIRRLLALQRDAKM